MSDLIITIDSQDDFNVTVTDQQALAPSVINVQEITPPNLNQLVGVSINNPQDNDGLFFDSTQSVWQNKNVAATNPDLDGGEFF